MFGVDRLRAAGMAAGATVNNPSDFVAADNLTADLVWEALLMLSQSLPDPTGVYNALLTFSNRAFKPLFP
eukprot:1772513-Amphidinium_carterae.1